MPLENESPPSASADCAFRWVSEHFFVARRPVYATCLLRFGLKPRVALELVVDHYRSPSKVRIPIASLKVDRSPTRIVVSPAWRPEERAEGGARWPGLIPVT